MLKRYLLFCYVEPQGGWHDLFGTYERQIEAEIEADAQIYKKKAKGWHIYDTMTCQLVSCKETYM